MTVRPTASGWTVVGSACVLVTAGTVFDYPEIVALGLAAAALAGAALAWVAVRPRVRAGRTVRPTRVPEGTSVTCELTVSNSGRSASQELEVTETVAGTESRFVVGALRSRSRTQVHRYHLPTDRRGVYELPPPSVRIVDPARLMRRDFVTEGRTTLHVHPIHHRLPLFGAGDRRDFDGMASTPRADGIAFYSLRDYVPGDDSRLIHWPSTARARTLMVRHNTVPDAPGYLVVLDVTHAPYVGGSFEEAVRIAASLCVAAIRDGARLHLRTTEHPLPAPPHAGLATATALDFLAGVRLVRHDVWWPTALACAEDVFGIAVVTGRADQRHLTAMARSVPGDTTVVVVRVDQDAEVSELINPIPVITVPSSAAFAAHWNGGR